jgi:hypothetical protein
VVVKGSKTISLIGYPGAVDPSGAYSRSIVYGVGVPDLIAPRGTIYLRIDGGAGSTLYIKETGDGLSTGWAAK